tara:strand:+ start:183 stop:761 length:579 start_codon:yes stop_codon:yes gene_type:complete
MNRFCRKLNIPKDIMPKLNTSKWNTKGLNWYGFHKEMKQIDFGQPFIDWMRSMNIYSRWMEVFYTPPNDVGIIHSDNIKYEDWCKIIFQFNAEGSTMRWWKGDISEIISANINTQYVNNQNEVRIAEEKDCELLYETDIYPSSLCNVGPLHSSYNPTNQKRFVLTYAPFCTESKERILWDDAINRFKSYINE